MQLVCKPVTHPTQGYLDQLRRIYEANIPAAERKPFQMLADGVTEKVYICMVAIDQGQPESIIALAFLMPLRGLPTIFLEYIAVDQQYQGLGIGSQMFRLMTKYFEDNKIADAIIWELEPSESDDPNHQTNKRIRFYEKLGAKMLDLSVVYAMPDFEANDGGHVPLRLMQLPLEAQPEKAAVASTIRSIYDIAYPEHSGLRDAILSELAKV